MATGRGRVARARVWLMVGCVVLLLTVTGFLALNKLKRLGRLANLPHRLGVNIKSEGDNISFSKSAGGKTLFTIHAAKSIEYSDGTAKLRHVAIDLYGRTDDRVDHISGEEFEYNRKTGEVRAVGEVLIDLQAPSQQEKSAASLAGSGGASGKARELPGRTDALLRKTEPGVIHVKTSGLIFLEKLGLAATEQEVDFEFRGMKGQARGAEYSSDTGVMVLEHAVEVDGGGQQQRPLHMTADRAELQRQTQQVLLDGVHYTSPETAVTAGRQASAGKAVLHLRRDGTVERMDAASGVSVGDGAGSEMTGQQAVVLFAEDNRPASAKFTGGVRYRSHEAMRDTEGEANDADVDFDAEGRVRQAVMTQAVHLHELDKRSRPADSRGDERELWAEQVRVAMKALAGKRMAVDNADATGGAHAVLVRPARAVGVGGAGVGADAGSDAGSNRVSSAGRTSLLADALHADFAPEGGSSRLSLVRGEGHTRLEQTSDAGAGETSTGDTLVMHFAPAAVAPALLQANLRVQARPGPANVRGGSAASGSLGRPAGGGVLNDAVQQGHVEIEQRSAPKPGQPQGESSRAKADRAVWDGVASRLVLTGSVELLNPGANGVTTIASPKITFERGTGDALAEGGVKATYLERESAGRTTPVPSGGAQAKAGVQPNGAEPVHMLADRAELHHDAEHAIFYGANGGMARLWEGGSQVEAPVLDYDEHRHLLTARADRGFELPGVFPVHAVLANGEQSNNASDKNAQPGRSGRRGAVVVRTASRQMVYSDEQHRVELTGGVEVEEADGTMTAQQATVFLADPAEAGAPQGTAGVSTGAAGLDGTGTGAAERTGAGSPAKDARAPGLLGGSVDHVVARGNVVVSQPGRRAEGEQVVYTAADGVFVMTGTPTVPPRVIDDVQGTLTGTTVRFDTKDNSVVVAGGESGERRQRVKTVTKVKQ